MLVNRFPKKGPIKATRIPGVIPSKPQKECRKRPEYNTGTLGDLVRRHTEGEIDIFQNQDYHELEKRYGNSRKTLIISVCRARERIRDQIES